MFKNKYIIIMMTFIIIVTFLVVCIKSVGSNDLSLWVNKYSYYEFIPPNISMKYNIDIYEEDDKYYANIKIDGFQTKLRAKAKVVGDENLIKLIFDSYLPNNLYEYYSQGDVLLYLEKVGTEVLTRWEELSPLKKENKEEKGLFFK